MDQKFNILKSSIFFFAEALKGIDATQKARWKFLVKRKKRYM